MSKKVIAALIACVLLYIPTMVCAQDNALADRVAALEESMAGSFFQKVEFSGALEAEATYSSDYADAQTSDIDLTTMELGINITLNDYVSGFALIKWEDDDEDVFLDEGGITLGNVETMGYAVTVGKLYVPFGVFETGMVSDPLTLEIGETREGAITVDVAAAGFYGAVYAFNSAISDDASDDTIDSYGLMAGYAFESDAMSLDLSAGWISNITSSGGYDGYLTDNSIDPVDEYTAGATVSAVIGIADFTIIAEYLAALDSDFSTATTEEPTATNIEVVYDFEMIGRAAAMAVAYQMTDEAVFLGLPETRAGATVSVEITKGVSIALEYIHDEDYDVADGGTGESADAVTCQLAFTF